MVMPLEDIKVLDLTQHAFGPRAAQYLAEMGAEVIKIESPQGGEPLRGVDVIKDVSYAGFNSYYEQVHRGKKSMAMDLHYEKAREVAHKLAADSDVFVTNLRERGLKRLGMDYETLSGINPRLIYALGTGWGMKGPFTNRGAFEVTGAAGSGLLTSFAEPGARPPLWPPALGDYMAATLLVYGIMVALHHRSKTGRGQMVHTSLLGSLMKMVSCSIDASLHAGKDMFAVPHERDGALYAIYQTKDQRWIQFAVLQDYESWAEFCRAGGIEHLTDDARFNTRDARRDNSAALISILDDLFLTKSQSEWIERFKDCQFPWSPVRQFTELASDPQVLENEYLVTLDHPEAGKVQVVGVNVDFSETPGRAEGIAPELGQHTEEILLNLGYDWEQIVAMKEEGAIL